MKLPRVLLLLALVTFSTGCASFSSPKGPPPTPTPSGQQIEVINAGNLPPDCSVVGTVRGSSMEMLKERARKLGADAIVNPTSVDPVSGYATTQAIKFAYPSSAPTSPPKPPVAH